MNLILFGVIFLTLIVLYFIVALRAHKGTTTTADYFLAGRNLGFFPVTFTLIATQLGGGILLGTSQKGFELGYLGIFYTLGICIGLLILGLGLAARLRSLQVSTTAELFWTKYKSHTLKKIASLLSIATLCGILIGQFVSSKALIFSLMPNNPALAHGLYVICWTLILTYTIIGGLKAVVMSDTFQVGLIIAVFSSIMVYLVFTQPSAWFFAHPATTQLSYFDFSWDMVINALPTLIMPALFCFIEQDLAQRFFAARTTTIAAAAALAASFFMTCFSLVPLFIGMAAKVWNIETPPSIPPLLPVLEHFTHEVVYVLAFCGIIAAITSTADSLLCAISSNVTQDFEFNFMQRFDKVRLCQLLTAIVGIGAFITSSIVHQEVIDVLVKSYELSVSTLLISLVVCYCTDRVYATAAWTSVITGGLCFTFFQYAPWQWGSLMTLTASAVAYVAAHIMIIGRTHLNTPTH